MNIVKRGCYAPFPQALGKNNIASSIYCMHFVQVISQADPDLVALHCQEIGGKDFEIQMPKVTEFIRYITALHAV